MTHRDPTFETVAQSEERGCDGCLWRHSLWGMQICRHPDKPEHMRPAGRENMRGCVDWTPPIGKEPA